MKKLLLALISGALSLFSQLALAGIDQIIQKAGPNVVMGVLVEDADTGRIIYQHNANRLFVPASSLKVYTAAAALIMLGPNFRFPTTVYTDAPSIKPGVLNGNLYVTFSGDPTLTSSDLVDFLGTLKQKGITRIQGNVVLVFPPYKAQKYPPGIAERDKLHPYGAPITPVIVDENAVTFTISSTSPGQLARVSIADPSGQIHISNALYTKRPASKGCGLSYHVNHQNQLKVQGCIRPRKEPYIERIPIVEPALYAAGVIRTALRYWQISVNGKVGTAPLPASAKLLGSHLSDALPVILADTLKPSNNLYANALYLKVGQMYWHNNVTWQNSGAAVKHVLQQYAGAPTGTAVLADGAGLSRENRVSPAQTVALLMHMEKKPALRNDFIMALPVPGQKGTLIHRNIASPIIQSRIHAKTGTMKGIVGLTGYLPSANKHTLVFSIITNAATNKVYVSDQIYLPLWKYRQLEDEICRYLMSINV